mmetsp:Transcript_4093/g.10992  ORF Transcript_4093/g.10992 Transcript_4093/m.10992 type:complete len:243 (+) Transcript_4093:200-928(+)
MVPVALRQQGRHLTDRRLRPGARAPRPWPVRAGSRRRPPGFPPHWGGFIRGAGRARVLEKAPKNDNEEEEEEEEEKRERGSGRRQRVQPGDTHRRLLPASAGACLTTADRPSTKLWLRPRPHTAVNDTALATNTCDTAIAWSFIIRSTMTTMPMIAGENAHGSPAAMQGTASAAGHPQKKMDAQLSAAGPVGFRSTLAMPRHVPAKIIGKMLPPTKPVAVLMESVVIFANASRQRNGAPMAR